MQSFLCHDEALQTLQDNPLKVIVSMNSVMVMVWACVGSWVTVGGETNMMRRWSIEGNYYFAKQEPRASFYKN